MDEFDDIRPYRDEEIPDKLSKLVDDPAFIAAVCSYKARYLHALLPTITEKVTRALIRRVSNKIHGINDLHNVLATYVDRVVRQTTAGFSYSGLENLPVDKPVLLISNHRDITLDSIFVNSALWLNDRLPAQMAVGENLFTRGFESEFMRLNGSFVVKRSADTLRAYYLALSKTSRYIRTTLEHGDSIWIAQREGRAKDGKDHTDPAIIKMFMLAYKGEIESIADWLDRVVVVPVALSYELDPCAPLKARELSTLAREGQYTKGENEDFISITRGLSGQKGQVHVGFGHRLCGEYDSEQSIATAIDAQIAAQIKQFPTFKEAALILQGKNEGFVLSGRLKQEFEAQLSELREVEKP